MDEDDVLLVGHLAELRGITYWTTEYCTVVLYSSTAQWSLGTPYEYSRTSGDLQVQYSTLIYSFRIEETALSHASVIGLCCE